MLRYIQYITNTYKQGLVKLYMDYKKIINTYKGLALIFLNTLVLLIMLNFIVFAGTILFKDAFLVGPLTLGEETWNEIYPDLSSEDQQILLQETYQQHTDLGKITRGYQYEPFTQFKENSRSGKFVNIDEKGFRHVEDQCVYPLDEKNYNIFVFGGSTTFGVGEIDSGSIPSKLQKNLREKLNEENICVYNFGRSFYYSSQERILFQELILKGQSPDMAFFIDGLNEPILEPQNTRRLENFMQGENKFLLFFSDFSIVRASNFITNRYFRSDSPLYTEDDLQKILDRYLLNKQLISSIGESNNIITHFVFQPIPNYKYDLSNHALFKRGQVTYDDSSDLVLRENFYSYADQYYQNLSKKERLEFIWLAGIQENERGNLYVDYAHYTANFADEISDILVAKIKDEIEIS